MSAAARDLLGRERAAIADLRALLGRLDAAEHDVAELKTALDDLEGLFMLVVCGEYNAGKSSLLNALLGERVMLEGVTPTTDRITIVSYGGVERTLEEGPFTLRREYPAPILRDLALVDTPGTNAVIKKHQELTESFVPRADLVLFVTSADRPFTESERSFLELIASWGKKIVLVVNKMDILEEESERAKVLAFVRDHAREALGVTPEVFGVEAKRAFRGAERGRKCRGYGVGGARAFYRTQPGRRRTPPPQAAKPAGRGGAHHGSLSGRRQGAAGAVRRRPPHLRRGGPPARPVRARHAPRV